MRHIICGFVLFEKGLCLKYYEIIHIHSRFSHHRGKKVMLFRNLIFTITMFLAQALRSLYNFDDYFYMIYRGKLLER